MAEKDQLIHEFATWLERNEGRSERTVTKYIGYIRLLQAWAKENGHDLMRVKTQDLEHFTGLYMHERGLRPRSRRAVVSSVRKFYKWLRRRGLVRQDPASDLTHPHAGKSLPVMMDLHHVEALIMAPGVDSFLGRRDTAIISLMAGCGLRVGGIVGLNESHLIFYLDDQKRERLAVKVTEKGSKQRIVPAPDDCWALVRAYLGDPELEGIDRALADGDQVLFVSTNNRNISPAAYHGEARRLRRGAVWDIIRRHGKRAGIPKHQMHPHALRHTFGTELAEYDVDLLVRQALMGHANASSTEVYTHLAQRKLREAMDKANPFRRVKTPVSSLIQSLRSGS